MQGPFIKSWISQDSYKSQWVYKSDQKPFKRPLPYKIYETRRLYQADSAGNFSFDPFDVSPGTARGHAYDGAYRKFVSRLKPDSSSLGAALGERSLSAAMLVKRFGQFTDFVRGLRARDFAAVTEALGLRSSRRRRAKKVWKDNRFEDPAKQASDMFLELHFGWIPLIKDIYNAVQTMRKGIPDPEVRASNHHSSFLVVADTPTFKHTKTVHAKVTVRASIRVANSDNWLLNQLGLINPIAVLWEVTPFSFVVDWFFNVSRIIDTMSDFAGLDLVDPITSTKVSTYEERIYVDPRGISPRVLQAWTCRSFQRELGIGSPTLKFSGFSPFSVPRLLSAVALTIQQLSRINQRGPDLRLFPASARF